MPRKSCTVHIPRQELHARAPLVFSAAPRKSQLGDEEADVEDLEQCRGMDRHRRDGIFLTQGCSL